MTKVVTDGETKDRQSVFAVIIPASRKITADEELDDNLIMVDTVTCDEMEDMTIAAVLTNAIFD